MEKCNNCPRNCIADRDAHMGFCRSPRDIVISKYMLHKWEEPCISGTGGAGAVFFSGCNLRCVFCQNKKISRGEVGKRYTDSQVLDIFLSLADDGAECIELITPTHYTEALIPILEAAKAQINLPFVWNCGGYESVDMLRRLDGLIDVYMPDIKYYSNTLASNYSSAPDYFHTAMSALDEMIHQTGKPSFNELGMLTSGVIVRHLVLPGSRSDSITLLSELKAQLGSPDKVVLSLMSQYTPEFYDMADGGYTCLTRGLTDFEYSSVLRVAEDLGFYGYFQGRTSATSKYTPKF